MTLRSALRQAIRDELNDNTATKLWADALLNEWINEAIRDYSRQLPEELQLTITAIADQTDYALPARFINATRVEQPKHTLRLPALGNRAPGTTGPLMDLESRVTRGQRFTYRVFGLEIILDPAPGGTGGDHDIRLEYTRYWAEPAADGDTISTPATDDEILIALVAQRAMEYLTTDEAKNLAYEARRGARVDTIADRYRARANRAFESRARRIRQSTLELA